MLVYLLVCKRLFQSNRAYFCLEGRRKMMTSDKLYVDTGSVYINATVLGCENPGHIKQEVYIWRRFRR